MKEYMKITLLTLVTIFCMLLLCLDGILLETIAYVMSITTLAEKLAIVFLLLRLNIYVLRKVQAIQSDKSEENDIWS